MKFIRKYKLIYKFLIVLVIICSVTLVSCSSDTENSVSTEDGTSKKTETEEEKQLPVIVGNYMYYVPDDAAIDYEDHYITVACQNYGIKSYSATGAPQTADAVAQLFGAVQMDPFTNANDVEGVIVENAYDSDVKIFCFTVDEVFHAIEIWTAPETTEDEWKNIFNTIAYVDIEKLRKQALNQNYADAHEQEIIDMAINAAEQTDNPDDNNEAPAGAYFKYR